jgi:hypothetical protein
MISWACGEKLHSPHSQEIKERKRKGLSSNVFLEGHTPSDLPLGSAY